MKNLDKELEEAKNAIYPPVVMPDLDIRWVFVKFIVLYINKYIYIVKGR